MSPYELLKCLYQKTEPNLAQIETWVNIQLNKWISTDQNSCVAIRKLIPYLLYIEPKHYYYLLWFNVRKQYKVPFYKLPKVVEIEQDTVVKRIQEILGWSNAEVKKNSDVLKSEILTNKDHWMVELGIEK